MNALQIVPERNLHVATEWRIGVLAYIVLHEMPYSLPCSLHREDHTGITRRAEPVVDEAGELEAMLEFKNLELANCMPSEVCICDCMLCEFGIWKRLHAL